MKKIISCILVLMLIVTSVGSLTAFAEEPAFTPTPAQQAFFDAIVTLDQFPKSDPTADLADMITFFEEYKAAVEAVISTYGAMSAAEVFELEDAGAITEAFSTAYLSELIGFTDEFIDIINRAMAFEDFFNLLNDIDTKLNPEQGEALTLADKAAIAELKAKYAAFTEAEKTEVDEVLELLEFSMGSTFAKLMTLADTGIAALQAAADATEADKAAAKAVSDKIAALGTITADKKDAVKAARAAYDALTAAQKLLVTNYKVLSDAETALGKVANPPTGESSSVLFAAAALAVAAFVVLKSRKSCKA